MIKTDNLEEYCVLSVLKSYCQEYKSVCESCEIIKLCDCMPRKPSNIEIEYKEEKDNEK